MGTIIEKVLNYPRLRYYTQFANRSEFLHAAIKRYITSSFRTGLFSYGIRVSGTTKTFSLPWSRPSKWARGRQSSIRFRRNRERPLTPRWRLCFTTQVQSRSDTYQGYVFRKKPLPRHFENTSGMFLQHNTIGGMYMILHYQKPFDAKYYVVVEPCRLLTFTDLPRWPSDDMWTDFVLYVSHSAVVWALRTGTPELHRLIHSLPSLLDWNGENELLPCMDYSWEGHTWNPEEERLIVQQWPDTLGETLQSLLAERDLSRSAVECLKLKNLLI